MCHYFKKNILKAVFIFLLFVFLMAANAALAEIKFNVDYPELPGVKNLLNAANSKGIGVAVAYYLKWFLLLAIFACIISLVWAGVQYISSTGQAGIMRQARERILNSFLGLAILIASYLVLHTLNPQIELLRITRTSTPSGSVVLLSQKAYDELDGTNLGDLRESGDIYFLTSDIDDATNKDKFFGELTDKTAPNSTEVNINFKNFNFYAIGFWGEEADNYKATIFSDKNFGTIKPETHGGNTNSYVVSQIYESRGKINPTDDKAFCEEPEPTRTERCTPVKEVPGTKMKMYKVNSGNVADLKRGQEFYYSYSVYTPDTGGMTTVTDMNLRPVPPLSFKIEGIGPGVYLTVKDSNGQEKEIYVPENAGIADLDATDIVEIKDLRIQTETKTKKSDLLTLLYDRANFMGNMAIYFPVRSAETVHKTYAQLFRSSQYFPKQREMKLWDAMQNSSIANNLKTQKDDDNNDVLESVQFVGLDTNSSLYSQNEFGRPSKGGLIKENMQEDLERDEPQTYGVVKQSSPYYVKNFIINSNTEVCQ